MIPMVRITMKDGGVIDLELDAQAAPITVENFLKLVIWNIGNQICQLKNKFTFEGFVIVQGKYAPFLTYSVLN